MKPFILTFLLLTACVVTGKAQYLQLTCDKPTQILNDHVGNEWRFGFGVNGTFIPIFQPVEVAIASAGSLEFIIQENDKYTDQASVLLDIDPTKLEWNKLYSRKLELTVTENGGRYKGNIAKWSVVVHFKKMSARA